MAKFLCALFASLNASCAVLGLLTDGRPWVIALNVGCAVFSALVALLPDRP